jgi:RNA polymerase sigma-70 factor (ECF subfamily)
MTASRRTFSFDASWVEPVAVRDEQFIRAEGDRCLLNQARDGDEKACRELIDRYGQRLLGVVTATQGDLQMAEDIVQETLIRAMQQAEQLREEASMFPWLVKIALRAALDYRRKVRRETLTDRVRDVAEAIESGPEHYVAQSEDSLRVRKALARLKPYQRELIVLRYFSSFSTAELAAVFSKSEAAIRKDLQRARERVKKHLGDWFEA